MSGCGGIVALGAQPICLPSQVLHTDPDVATAPMAEGDKEGWGGKKGMRWVRRKGERGRELGDRVGVGREGQGGIGREEDLE